MSDGPVDISAIPEFVVGLVGGAGLTRGVLLEHLGVQEAAEDALLCATLGLDPHTLKELRDDLRARLETSADALLADASFVAAVDRLPFTAGERIVVVGDSISAAANSWANLLQVVLARRGIELVNRAVSGRSSTDTISVFGRTLALNPDWILLMIGGNDVRRHGQSAGVRLLTTSESVRNIGELRRLAGVESRARVITIPSHPPVDPRTIDQNRAAGTYWLEQDVVEARRAILNEYPDSIDLTYGLEVDADYWSPDGIHPSATGQRRLLRVIIDELATRTEHTS